MIISEVFGSRMYFYLLSLSLSWCSHHAAGFGEEWAALQDEQAMADDTKVTSYSHSIKINYIFHNTRCSVWLCIVLMYCWLFVHMCFTCTCTCICMKINHTCKHEQHHVRHDMTCVCNVQVQVQVHVLCTYTCSHLNHSWCFGLNWASVYVANSS